MLSGWKAKNRGKLKKRQGDSHEAPFKDYSQVGGAPSGDDKPPAN